MAALPCEVTKKEVEAKLTEFREKFDIQPDSAPDELERAARTSVARFLRGPGIRPVVKNARNRAHRHTCLLGHVVKGRSFEGSLHYLPEGRIGRSKTSDIGNFLSGKRLASPTPLV